MKNYIIIDAPEDDLAFEYWIAGADENNPRKLSQLINMLEGSDRLKVGDIISFQFNTQRLGFDRNLQEDFNAYNFKIVHKKFEYIFLTSNDFLDLFEEYVLKPIPRENKSLNFAKVVSTFSFHYWYVDLKNQHLMDHVTYAYWSEYGGLDDIFDNLSLNNNLQIGECFYFDLNSDHVFGTLRNLTKDFNTNYFQVLRIQNEFIEGNSSVEIFRSYELAPFYRS